MKLAKKQTKKLKVGVVDYKGAKYRSKNETNLLVLYHKAAFHSPALYPSSRLRTKNNVVQSFF